MDLDWKKVAIGGALGGIPALTLGAPGGFFNKSRGGGSPNIEGELAKIGALFQAQLAAAKASNAETARQQGSQARNNLAARGTYRSPVAENVFGEIRNSQMQADAQAAGQLAGAEAQMRGSLLAQLLGYDQQNRQLKGQQNAAIFSQGGSLLSSLLLASILKNPAPLVSQIAPSAGNAAFPQMTPQSFFRNEFGPRTE